MEPQLKLFRPIQSDKMTQAFGEHDVCCKTLPGGFPRIPFQVVNKINGVCPPGTRDFYSTIGLRGHGGQDNAAWDGEPTYHSALFSGFAQICRFRPNGKPDTDGGLNVISHDTFPCTLGCAAGTKHNLLIRYAHGTPTVADNAKITPGSFIMRAGSFGSSTGVHVHFAPKYCSPTGKILHQDNGYEGAFDPTPYFQNTFILDFIKDSLSTKNNGVPTIVPPHPSLPPVPPEPVPLSAMETLKKVLFQLAVFLKNLSPLNH